MSDRPRVALTLQLWWPQKRHSAIFAGTQQYGQQHGWESIIDEYAAENLSDGRSRNIAYDGVIARAGKKLCERAERLGVPVVNVWYSSPVRDQLPGVFADFDLSGRLRAEHLLARGLRRFAALERKDRTAVAEVAAFRAAVEQAGFECITEKIPLDPARSHAVQQRFVQQINDWMNRWVPPIGVFVTGDETGRIVTQVCHQRGLRVPQDVAIIAGQNEETICEHPRPSLTSMELGQERIGFEAARLLDQLMAERRKRGAKKEAKSPPRHIFFPPQGIVVRESTDFFAVDDEVVARALAFIAANSHRQIGQEDVAQAVALELRTLQRRFRKVLDRPIVAMIRHIRIERAKRELIQSNRTLQQIARDAGFGKAMRMYDVFRRELGITPSEYRRQRQVKNES